MREAIDTQKFGMLYEDAKKKYERVEKTFKVNPMVFGRLKKFISDCIAACILFEKEYLKNVDQILTLEDNKKIMDHYNEWCEIRSYIKTIQVDLADMIQAKGVFRKKQVTSIRKLLERSKKEMRRLI